jgi:predicted AAA+ superfamily ATPase
LTNIPSILSAADLSNQNQAFHVQGQFDYTTARSVCKAYGAKLATFDEIQKAPQLLDVVHSLVEERPHLRFVLSGSSARKFRRGAANLLGGRPIGPADAAPPRFRAW